jgi:hypothetical protein
VADDLDDQIRDNAAGPAKVSGDAGSVEQHSLADQVEAAKFLAAKEAVKKKHRGLRISRLSPPGAD